MGRQAPERREAIEAGLAEIQASLEEEIAEATAMSEADEARMIEDEQDFCHRVTAIYGQIDQHGQTPQQWMSQQDDTTENRMILKALVERWETENMSDPDDYADWPDHYYSGRSGYKPLTDQEIAEEKAAEDWHADRFNSPDDYLDEWNSSAIPMSTIQDL